jgi:hypothetical protein
MDELAVLVRELPELSAQAEPADRNRGAAAPMRDLPLTLGLALLLGKPAEDAAPSLKVDSDGTLF